MAHVQLTGVTKNYGDVTAVRSINLGIEKGEFFSLLGPSGCGKTTTLRIIAGFVAPTAGSVMVGGSEITYLPPEKRGIGFVFQNYAIFPHMTVYDNIAFGLRMRKVGKAEIDKKVHASLEQVGLRGLEARYEREMSGGQKQRVALARVLVTEPQILLLDEPLSALDKKLREEMKYWIKDLQQALGITTIYVTHDQGEALTMSDRIAVMNDGRVEQVGTPDEIYEQPESNFVTNFIGHSNILPATVRAIDNGTMRVETIGIEVEVPRTGDAAPEARVSLVVRPEHIILGAAAKGGNDIVSTRGQVTAKTYQGQFIRYELAVGEVTLIAEALNRPGIEVFAPGAEVEIGWHTQSCSILTD
jgi:putative spermidine/putrescine transport system ATP-binding protein